MKIVTTSDFHGNLPDIPECDLLLIAGDIVPRYLDDGAQFDWLRRNFRPWMNDAPAKEIVWVAGNHDTVLSQASHYKILDLGGTYLHNSSVKFGPFKIWGSPYSPTFGNWPFMEDDPYLFDHWAKIPYDTDILVVHGPPHGYGDMTFGYMGEPPENVGSRTLRNRLYDLPRLKLVVTGHIHPAYGSYATLQGVKVINASHVDNRYEPVNSPIILNMEA